MKVFNRLMLGAVVSFSLCITPWGVAGQKKAVTPAQTTAAKPAAAPVSPPQAVSPIDLLKSPDQYLNKTVQFTGTFNSFSSLGLDYPKAMRDSKDYVSLMILRPDVSHHQIPLSELKLFYPRKKSESLITLNQGDKIQVRGKVFSKALSDPWVDVEDITVISKVKKSDDKAAELPSP